MPHPRRSAHLRALLVVCAVTAFAMLPAGRGVRASNQVDLDAPYALTTSATGLVPATTKDWNIAIARLDLTAGKPVDDPVSGLPGFLIVIEGNVVIDSGASNPVAVLGEGDSLWLPTDVDHQFRTLNYDAAVWRVAISPEVTGQDIGKTDPYTIGVSRFDVPKNEVTPYVVRTGLLAGGATASLAGDDENVAYAFSLSGTVEVENDTIDSGQFVSPLLSNPHTTANEGAALIGYIAWGAAIDLSAR